MKKLLITSAVALALSGCGGSGGSSNSNPAPQLSPSATGVIENNPIDGSISVNGNQYVVDSVYFQNQLLDPAVLAQNMMVRVDTTTKTQNANVTLEPTISGIVTDRQGTSFSVNGIALEFEFLDDDIEIGDWVFVSSLPTANAGYKVLSVVEIDVENTYPNLATYFEIEGRISSVDYGTSTLILSSNISVNFASAHELPREELKAGQWVEIEGYHEGDHFVATEIELDDYNADSVFDDIEGVVTSVENLSTGTPSFTLNFRGSFLTDNATCYKNDDGACDKTLMSKLESGVEVEVTSRFTGEQRIATVVEFEDPDWGNDSNDWLNTEFECEGIVSNYDVNKDTFQITRCENDNDQLLQNNTVVIDAQTRFEGIEKLNLNGSYIDVEGIIINNQNIAREIELKD